MSEREKERAAVVRLTRRGLYVLLRYATDERPALGFVIKRWSCALFSERYGYWRGVRIGPLYFRTYHRRNRAIEQGQHIKETPNAD